MPRPLALMFSVLYLLTSLKAINIISFSYCREVAVALSAKSNYPILLHEAVELEQGVQLGFRYRHRIAGMSTLPWKRVPRSDQAFQAIFKVFPLNRSTVILIWSSRMVGRAERTNTSSESGRWFQSPPAVIVTDRGEDVAETSGVRTSDGVDCILKFD